MSPESLLSAAEEAVTAWLAAHGAAPEPGEVEGYRLLALHRQAARIAPNFLACRETCRELIYQINCAAAASDPAEHTRRLRLADMAGTHLSLFVAGSLETAGLGTFCCAARPLHAPDAAPLRS
ncbi:MAG: hypothetical protein ACP5NP_07095 [Acetobacteraceae bacterium]